MAKDSTLKFICFFLIIASFVYVFVGITGVNLPAYYPVLHQWSVTPIKDAVSMGFYGRVAFTLIFSLLVTYAMILLTKNNETKEETLIGFTKASVIFGVLFFVAEEWHKWGIEKMKFDTQVFLNYEFWFFLAVSLVALSATCLTTGNCRRKK